MAFQKNVNSDKTFMIELAMAATVSTVHATLRVNSVRTVSSDSSVARTITNASTVNVTEKVPRAFCAILTVSAPVKRASLD